MHVEDEDAAAAQIEDAGAPPDLQLPVDALACRADIIGELFLRNTDFAAEVLAEPQKAAGEPNRQRQQTRLFETVAYPSQSLTQELDDANRDLRILLQQRQEVGPFQNEKLGRLRCDRIGSAALSVEECDFAEHVAGAEHVESQGLARARARLDADLAASDAIERIAFVAFDEQGLARPDPANPAKRRETVDCRIFETREKRIGPQELGEIDGFRHGKGSNTSIKTGTADVALCEIRATLLRPFAYRNGGESNRQALSPTPMQKPKDPLTRKQDSPATLCRLGRRGLLAVKSRLISVTPIGPSFNIVEEGFEIFESTHGPR